MTSRKSGPMGFVTVAATTLLGLLGLSLVLAGVG
jgi:hypothetical protein